MEKTKYLVIAMTITMACLAGGKSRQSNDIGNMIVVAETDSFEILQQVVDSAKDEFDISEVAIWMRNKVTGAKTRLFQTVRPDWHCWYISDGNEFVPIPIDSIYAASRVYIYNENPLQLIVEGCPDCRNEFSYFVDIASRKAWWVPANSGYLGGTEEDYMVFRSYRYVSDPDIAGRYTFLQVFNDKGVMVDSLNLEHVKLEAERNYNEADD